MNHATSCEIIVRKKNCGTIFKTVRLRKTGQDPMHFFPAIHVFFPATHVSKVFGPDTAPIWSRYGPDTATEVHFSKNSTAKGWYFFEKIGTIKN